MVKKLHSELSPPLRARRGRELIVVGVARISGIHQDAKSLDDQEGLYREWLGRHTELPYKLYMIASRGSGERVDTKEVKKLRKRIKSERIDLVLAEDIGRIMRRAHSHLLCEDCEDHDTRLIAINDHIDTAQPDWRLHSLFASFRHENYNKDTALRIRRTQRNRFLEGGMFKLPIFGYIKPPGAKHEDDIVKADWAEPIYDQWFTLLEEGASYSEVADWLESMKMHLPAGSRGSRWTGPLVRNTTFNTLLKGIRQHNRRVVKRINKTGRRKQVKAPATELLQREVPQLRFIDAERYDRLIVQLTLRNEKYTNGRAKAAAARSFPSDRRSRWPGNHVFCGICGRKYVWGGHGRKDSLMCDGARKHKCWNGVTFDGPLAAQKLSAAIFSAIEDLPDFESTAMALVQQQLEEQSVDLVGRRTALEQCRQRLDREIDNAVSAIVSMGGNASLAEKLVELEAERSQVAFDLQELATRADGQLPVVTSVVIKRWAQEAFQELAVDSPRYARLMRKLIPKIVVFPYELWDKGGLVLRAKFRLNLANLDGQARHYPCLQEACSRQLVVDLFQPPQRVALREQVMALRATNTERAVATALKITLTAAQRAASLDRQMRASGATDPYVEVSSPPVNHPNYRRHLHSRYYFDPLPDAGVW